MGEGEDEGQGEGEGEGEGEGVGVGEGEGQLRPNVWASEGARISEEGDVRRRDVCREAGREKRRHGRRQGWEAWAVAREVVPSIQS